MLCWSDMDMKNIHKSDLSFLYKRVFNPVLFHQTELPTSIHFFLVRDKSYPIFIKCHSDSNKIILCNYWIAAFFLIWKVVTFEWHILIIIRHSQRHLHCFSCRLVRLFMSDIRRTIYWRVELIALQCLITARSTIMIMFGGYVERINLIELKIYVTPCLVKFGLIFRLTSVNGQWRSVKNKCLRQNILVLFLLSYHTLSFFN